MSNLVLNEPVMIRICNSYSVEKNVLSHHVDVVEEMTLALEHPRQSFESQVWFLEQRMDTKTYFVRAYGKVGKGHCLTTLQPDYTLQSVGLEPVDYKRQEQHWRIHKNSRGSFRLNNLLYQDKYLAKVPGSRFDDDLDIAMLSPPYEIIEFGYAILDWEIKPLKHILNDKRDYRFS
ncbi:hypothetical protein EKN38_22260 [Enterobacter sp. WCHEn045836]|uniref:hypothetical protein n=1 Tax=Enterobacter sp. WCHEn045836 TaxID=2497434 RepID=UPI000F84CBD5|nr:hypothetical protein [Enterobacter sp. WCHEn045836]RTP97270.1 hypothetical protein EKN38_22260 [Enterobacter sp. WCHEn045836]